MSAAKLLNKFKSRGVCKRAPTHWMRGRCSWQWCDWHIRGIFVTIAGISFLKSGCSFLQCSPGSSVSLLQCSCLMTSASPLNASFFLSLSLSDSVGQSGLELSISSCHGNSAAIGQTRLTVNRRGGCFPRLLCLTASKSSTKRGSGYIPRTTDNTSEVYIKSGSEYKY